MCGSVCQLTPSLKYYFYRRTCDMRKSFQGLQGIVNEEYGRYLTSNEAFIFIGKNRSTVKILHREGNGLTLYLRKLENGLFQLPILSTDTEDVINLDYDNFILFILGEKWVVKS